MTLLDLALSHQGEHKFNRNFQNCINLFCCCVMKIESISYFFLHCPLFHEEKVFAN